ncbi:MAG: glycosyltransferase family 4 protein [Actinomycetota bacterium]|nr:glycosyltransferase family 4 protein [Actinomycetota bacterium]
MTPCVLQVMLHDGMGGAETLARHLDSSWTSRIETVALDRATRQAGGSSDEDRSAADGGWMIAQEIAAAVPEPHLRRLYGLRQLITSARPDVVLAHSALPAIYSRLATATLARPPAVCTVLHSAADDYATGSLRRAERLLAPRTAAVVAVSDAKATEYVGHFPAMRDRVHVIANGILAGPLRPDGPPACPVRLLATSRLHPQKDLGTLLHGIRAFLDTPGAPVLELRIAGGDSDPQYAGELRELAGRLGLDAAVTFLGARTDIAELLAGSDVFVHSALREAAPLGVLEAAAAAVPMLVTDLPHVRSTRLDCATFPPGDPAAFAAALRRVLDDYPAATAQAVALRPRILAEYSMATTTRRYAAVLGTLPGRSAGQQWSRRPAPRDVGQPAA